MTGVTPPAGQSRGRIVAARILVVVGVLLTVVSLLANFVKREALDPSTFKQTSSELIANPTIRDQVAATMVEELYANVDVSAQLQEKLPSNLQGLAGPIAGISREVADRAATELLARPRVQDIFIRATAVSQRQLVDVLHGNTDVVSTSNGNVVLDLRPLVLRLGDRFNFVDNLADRIPEGSAQVTILESKDLSTAQTLTRWLESVANWIWVLALAAWAVAFWLVRGRRRKELRAIAVGLAVSGAAVLVIRSLVGSYFVNHLVATDSVRPAAREVWRIVTDGLAVSAWGVLTLGVLAAIGAWVAGSGHRATTVRGWLAPLLRRPELAWGAFALVILFLVWALPLHRFAIAVALIVLAAVGFEVLRRQVAREFPDATAPDVGGAVREKLAAARPARAAAAPPSQAAELERLAALKAAGDLTDDEYAAAKAKLIGS